MIEGLSPRLNEEIEKIKWSTGGQEEKVVALIQAIGGEVVEGGNPALDAARYREFTQALVREAVPMVHEVLLWVVWVAPEPEKKIEEDRAWEKYEAVDDGPNWPEAEEVKAQPETVKQSEVDREFVKKLSGDY